MQTINGVEIYLLIDGQQITPNADGYVGELHEANTALIGVSTCLPNIYAFDVDGKKNVVLRRNIAADIELDPKKNRVFEQRITIKFGEVTGIWHTEYPHNHLRLLELGENGQFKIYEIGLVSQDGQFFLTVQKIYTETCFRGENEKLTCPAFDNKWPQFVKILSNILLGAELLPASEYHPQKNNSAAPLAKNTARVIWWNQAQGLGMVAVDKSVSPNGVARIHWSNLSPRTENNFAYLEEGEIVQYDATRTPHQTKMRDTSFKCELLNVHLI